MRRGGVGFVKFFFQRGGGVWEGFGGGLRRIIGTAGLI